MPKIAAGWNMPGYLPEMEPSTFDNAAEATAFLIDALINISDEYWATDIPLVNQCDEIINELYATTDMEGSYHLDGSVSIPSGLVFWWAYADDE